MREIVDIVGCVQGRVLGYLMPIDAPEPFAFGVLKIILFSSSTRPLLLQSYQVLLCNFLHDLQVRQSMFPASISVEILGCFGNSQ